MTKQKTAKLKKPAGGRTKITPFRLDEHDIVSIHAPGEGSDALQTGAGRIPHGFNPRSR